MIELNYKTTTVRSKTESRSVATLKYHFNKSDRQSGSNFNMFLVSLTSHDLTIHLKCGMLFKVSYSAIHNSFQNFGPTTSTLYLKITFLEVSPSTPSFTPSPHHIPLFTAALPPSAEIDLSPLSHYGSLPL